ncbi:hypothetical protein [Desulfosporosinus orientis]|nr:hypothetical protein [Desulfosporosinus orientis]
MFTGIALKALEMTINNSFKKNPHTEIMLWQSLGYSSNPQLYFFGTEIQPRSDKIIVNYKMENKSDKVINIKNLIDVGVVKADANSIGDPGTLIWRWSQHYKDIGDKTIELSKGDIFEKQIEIDRKNLDIAFQYYINIYYNDEIVAQYKVIEGICDK